jgi:hypothetical protein
MAFFVRRGRVRRLPRRLRAPFGVTAVSTGTLSQSLGALTASAATAVVAVVGVSAPTLGALTGSGSATAPVVATGGGALGALTVSAVGTTESQATVAATLGALTLSSAATVGASDPEPVVTVRVRSAVTIQDGGLAQKDPQEQFVVEFDWDLHIASGAEISASTWTLVAVRPSTATLITSDQAGFSERAATVRLAGGVNGAKYRVTNTITTDESPAQVLERSFYLLIQDR